jgi:hypothetical protein
VWCGERFGLALLRNSQVLGGAAIIGGGLAGIGAGVASW